LTLVTPPSEPQAQTETKASDTPADREPDLGLALAPADQVVAGTEGVVIVDVRPVGPFARHRERAEFVVSEAQCLNPCDTPNLQDDESLSAQGMKRVNNFNRFQGLVG
jgi:hypothetical protein